MARGCSPYGRCADCGDDVDNGYGPTRHVCCNPGREHGYGPGDRVLIGEDPEPRTVLQVERGGSVSVKAGLGTMWCPAAQVRPLDDEALMLAEAER